MILEQLLSEGKTAVAVVIGSHDSLKATTNTIGTLQGLEAAVARLTRPIVMHYKENDPSKPHSTNNLKPIFVMQCLSMLVSGKNKHLDSADVRNTFDYNKVTHHQPGLAMLDVFGDADKLIEANTSPIAFAALLRDPDEIVPQISPDYDTVGYLPSVKTTYANSFYYVVSTDALGGIFTELNVKREKAEKQKKVASTQTSLLNNNSQTDDDTGLVF